MNLSHTFLKKSSQSNEGSFMTCKFICNPRIWGNLGSTFFAWNMWRLFHFVSRVPLQSQKLMALSWCLCAHSTSTRLQLELHGRAHFWLVAFACILNPCPLCPCRCGLPTKPGAGSLAARVMNNRQAIVELMVDHTDMHGPSNLNVTPAYRAPFARKSCHRRALVKYGAFELWTWSNLIYTRN